MARRARGPQASACGAGISTDAISKQQHAGLRSFIENLSPQLTESESDTAHTVGTDSGMRCRVQFFDAT
jgi:hypothetical protein